MAETESQVSRRLFLRGVVAGSVGLIAQSCAADQAALPPAASAAPEGVQDAARRGDALEPPAPKKRVEARINMNQVGFQTAGPKRAVVPATGAILGNSFVLVDDAVVPVTRYRGTLTEYQGPNQSGHYARHFFADFDEFTRPGRYRLRLSDGSLSAPFTVGDDVYEQLVPLVLQYFDIQRCGPQASAHRGPCHQDDGVISGGPRHGERIDASGGWHDAGDYLKFVETTSYVAAIMLFAYDHYKGHLDRALARRQPEENGLPLPLAYAKIGLDWLLKMHPGPNEFYYQVGDETDHDSWRLPETDTPKLNASWKPRPVLYGVGANLAGRTAAALAIASRLYRPYDPAYAARCLRAAKSAYRLGRQNPRILTTQPADFYPETTWHDDMEWGAIDLYKATGQAGYLRQAIEYAGLAGSAHTYTSVYNVHAMAHYTLYPYAPAPVQRRLLEFLHVDAEIAREHSQSNPYGLGTPYLWGTAEAAAGAAITGVIYAEMAGKREYAEIARRQRDFILGCNPFGLCCLVGAGTRYPLFPHHQVANLKNIELTGAIVGGPCDLKTYEDQHISDSDVEFSTQSPSPPPRSQDTSHAVGVYHDVVEDYVTNEPANDYTAKFLLLAAFYIGTAEEPRTGPRMSV